MYFIGFLPINMMHQKENNVKKSHSILPGRNLLKTEKQVNGARLKTSKFSIN